MLLLLRLVKNFGILSASTKTINTMLVFFSSILLFVRTAFGSVAPYRTKLSENTFEWLKIVTLIVTGFGGMRTNYRSISPVRDDLLVQRALGASAAAIKHEMTWDQNIASKDIVLSPEKISEELEAVIVWKDTSIG